MQTSFRYLDLFFRSKKPIHLFILLAIFEIFNSQISTLSAEELHAHPGAIVFKAIQGHSLSDNRSIFIFTTLGTTLNWSRTISGSWLTTNLSNGNTATDTILKVGVNVTGMSSGIYSGSITLDSPQSSTDPVVVSVTLVINPDVPVSITTWKDGHSGAMSVSVDDSQGSGFDPLQANGFSGTYVLEGVTPPSYYSSYYNAGMELGSHTVHHYCQGVSDDALRTQEIQPNIQALCANTPEPCKDIISFAWPCGFTKYREQAVTYEYFLSARGYNINQLEDATPDNFMNLKSYNSHEHYPYPPSDFKTLVDNAVAQKKWYNLVLHDYTNDDGAINYAPSKDIWVTSIGTVIKYILQRDRFILTNYNASYDRITYNVSRLLIPSSVYRSFENAFDPNDVITMQIDIDDSKTVENVFIDGVSNPFQTKNLSGNIVLLTNVSLSSSNTKTVEIKYHITTIGLTITGVTANNKVYNGNTTATLNTGSASLIGVVPGDVVTLVATAASGSFANKNAGSAIVVSTSGFTLTGADAAKYTLTQPSTTADITKAGLSITGVTANSKVYNGTVTATLNTGSASLVGIVSGDVVSLVSSGATGIFDDKNVGTGKTVSTSGFSIVGTASGNYSLTQPTLTANITAAGLSITGITANNKVYDGTTAATLNTGSATLVGVLGTDVVLLISTNATGSFVNKNVGTSKVVSASGFTLGGTGSGNYTLAQPTTSANITKYSLVMSGVTVNNKVYNGTAVAVLNTGGAVLEGVIPGDAVTLVSSGATGTFINKNVGNGKSVSTSGFTLGGIDAANYSLTQPGLVANITPANLTISGVTAKNKVYDGTTAAILNTGTATLVGVFGSDAVSLILTGATGTFENANIGTAKVVYTYGFTLDGTDSGNYTLIQPITTANITGIILTVTGVTVNNKVYDGTTSATLNTGSTSLVGVIGGDIVSLVSTAAIGTFENKNIGTGKTVTMSGFELTGSDAGKYTLTQPITTADISKASLAISGVTANNKVYNRTTMATLNTGSASLVGVFGSDLATLNSTGATGAFANKNVGTNKAVSISGFVLGGADAGNYTLTQPSSAADITSAALTISGVTANNKVYDGTTTASLNTGSAVLVGVFGGDNVNLLTSESIGTFADANVGLAKLVSTSGFALGGSDSGNYSLAQPNTTADITGINLTISGVTSNSKIYNGTTSATLNTGGAVLLGVVPGDVVSLITTDAIGVFVNKNVGTGKSVSTSSFKLGGSDAGKYSLTQPTLVANITTASLTVLGVIANNRVYNGTAASTLNTGSATLVGVFGTDAVTLVSTGVIGTFSDRNVGNDKEVSISGLTLGGTDSGNYSLTQPSATANITTAGLTVSGVMANNKVYDGNTAATLNTGSAVLSGVFGTDVVTLVSTGATGTFTNKSAGTAKVVTTSGFTIGGSDAANYILTQPTATANITEAGLTVSGVTANDKVYNGTTAATLNAGSAVLSGIIAGDVVSLVSTGASGTFINKNVGSGKSVSTSGFSLGGLDAGNYALTLPSSVASITPAGLMVSGVTVNKVYDGTTTAVLNTGSASLVGVFGGDIVTLISTGAVGTFLTRNAGTGKSVSTSGFTLGGTDAGNYTLIQPILTANITAAGLIVSGLTANNKIYDRTNAATLNTGSLSLSGVIGGDDVSLISTGVTGTFVNKNVGTAKAITISGFTLVGTDVGNYILTQPSTTANITPSGVTISGVTANNKVYNGTTTATLNTANAVLSGVIGGDIVNLVLTGATGTFVNKNVGTGKVVSTSGFTLGGTDAGNYTVTQPSSAANITTNSLTVSGVTVNSKGYDGTTAATLNTGNATLVGVFGTDVVTLISTGATGIFANQNVGTGKTVSTSGFTLSGTDVANYTLTQPSTTGNITGIVLTITGITAENKVYNGTASANLNTGNASLSGVFGTDVVTLVTAGATGNFNNKNVGTGKAVLTSGFTLGGTDAGNYTITQPTTTASITRASLTISGVTANNKVYDGTTIATLNTGSSTFVGVYGTDIVTLVLTGATGTFLNKNVGTAKAVAISGLALGGTDAANYTLTQPSSAANITTAGLTVSGLTASNKVYDATTAVILNTESAVLEGVKPGDVVSLVTTGGTGVFANKNAGTAKIVSTSGFAINGTDVGNYNLIQPAITANILPAALTINGVTANNKLYDASTVATLNSGSASLSGVIGADVVTLVSSGAKGIFMNKNVGTAKSVSTSGFTLVGADGGNYTITLPSAVANITTKGLTVSGVVANNKVYDGTTTATLNSGNASLIGVLGTDMVTLTSAGAIGNFEDKNVGTSKIVFTSGLGLDGNDAVNYSLAQPTLIADLSPKAVTIIANDLYKHFQATLTFTGAEFTTEGLIPGDAVPVVTLSSPGEPASAEVGKYPITVSGVADANYIFSYVSGTLTVGKSTLIVKADNKTKFYGSDNPEFSITYSGFFKNEDASVLDVEPVITTTALNTSDAGTYSITLSGGTDDNYDLTLVNGTMEIIKAPLAIKAEDKTKVYGEVNPGLTINYSGFVLGQDQRVLDVRPIAETDANIDSDAGNYDINISGAVGKNYNFIYSKGTLTINKAEQLITFADIPSGLRMTQNYNLSATASSMLDVSFEVSDPSIASLNGNTLLVREAGNLTITAKQEGDQNWNPAPEIAHSIETLPTFDNISSLFTPNNDGMNDYWYIPELEQYGKMQVTVYNRFGQAVYQSNSYKNDWDGTWNGYPLPSAAYYYVIKSSAKGFIKGVVNIVR